MPSDGRKTRAELLQERDALRNKLKSRESKQKSLDSQQERYRNFLDDPIMPGCYEMDLRGKITFLNRSLHEKLGYSREEYLELANYVHF